MYVIVAGGGKVGANVARSLIRLGNEVTLIEQRRDRFERLEEEFEHQVQRGDATELFVLERAGITRPPDIMLALYLIPRTSLLIAAHLPPGQPMCLSHDHMRLLHALEEGSEESANREMQAHLLEIETRLSATTPPASTASLRDMLRMNPVS